MTITATAPASSVVVFPNTVPNREGIFSTIADSVSEGTKKTYAQSIRTMSAFYERNGWSFYPLSFDAADDKRVFVERVLSYLRFLADEGRTYSTINKTLAAVKYVSSFENPQMFVALQAKVVSQFMDGLKRQMKTHEEKKAQSLTVVELHALYSSLDPFALRDVRDKAMLTLGVATALRSQSIADLTLSDVLPTLTTDGLNIRVRFSKTDQIGGGSYIPVARVSNKTLDPIAALTEWIAVLRAFGFTAESHPDFPLFPVIRGTRNIQPSKMLHPSIAITEMLRSRLVEAGIVSIEKAQAYSPHSLRSTFITLSNQAGVAGKDIALISGHRDMNTLRSYDRTSVEQSAQTDYLSAR